MLVAACVCPHPPLLIPAVAAGAADETARLRELCVESVCRLAASGATRIVVVGSASATADQRDRRGGGDAAPRVQEWESSAGGTMHPYGADVSFGGRDIVLPLSLTIGAYLLDMAGWTGSRRYVALTEAATADEAAAVGQDMTAGPDAVALLVMGDGSSKRSVTSPGYFDERAASFDAVVVSALATPDVTALLRLDPVLCRDLWVAGRGAWQVLAGAAQATYEDGASISTGLRYDEAPYGVGYYVVDWDVERP